MNTLLCCPLCREALTRQENRYACPKGHSFDVARQGYVNLLMSQRSSARQHGDDKGMVEARRNFLEQGYYLPLRNALAEAGGAHCPQNAKIVDAGCGEGWYTAAVAAAFPQGEVYGFDISKDALRWAAKRFEFAGLAVASCYGMPLADASLDGLLNIFSPLAAEEYARVLKKGGCLFRVVPGGEHLWDLKAAIYDTPLLNKPEPRDLPGLTLVQEIPVRYELELKDPAHIMALFQMTPYYYRTSPKDHAKARALTYLKTRIEFDLLVYKKGSTF